MPQENVLRNGKTSKGLCSSGSETPLTVNSAVSRGDRERLCAALLWFEQWFCEVYAIFVLLTLPLEIFMYLK